MIKHLLVLSTFAPIVLHGALLLAALPSDEPGVIAYLTAKEVSITRDDAGHAVKLTSSGSPPLSAEEYQLIGLRTNLEELGLNGAPLTDDQWGFLKMLSKLKKLSIWHCGKFGGLEPFSGLPVESLTIGGCMGLRDLNKEDAAKLRNAITTLHDLPNLKRANIYHSPLAPDDAHLRHVAKSFPQLADLRLDFGSPRGSKTAITPQGLASLQSLPLTVLSIENAHDFTPEHFEAIAGIKTLKAMLVDSRKQPAPVEGVAAFQKRRPDVEVVISQPGDTGPPRVKSTK